MRILIVEDDKKVASFLGKGLREEGYSVDVTHDGKDGLLKAHVHDYDLLLLDVMLPGATGLEIFRELRARESTVPALLLDAGADDYLTKPFSVRTHARFEETRQVGSSRAARRATYEARPWPLSDVPRFRSAEGRLRIRA